MVTAVLVLLMAVAVIVPVASLYGPVPPVTLPLNVLPALVVAIVPYRKPPSMSSATSPVPDGPMDVTFRSSNPMVLPVLLTPPRRCRCPTAGPGRGPAGCLLAAR